MLIKLFDMLDCEWPLDGVCQTIEASLSTMRIRNIYFDYEYGRYTNTQTYNDLCKFVKYIYS